MQTREGLKPVPRRPGIPLAAVLVEAWAAERAQTKRPRGMRVELKIGVFARNGSDARAETALRRIEHWCLRGRRPRKLDAEGSRYELTLAATADEPVDESARQLLDSMHSIADERDCDLEVTLRHRPSGRCWS